MRFLLVDDEPQARAGLRYAITKLKPQAELVEAAAGQEALDLVKALQKEGKPIDIAFLDIDMPDMTGIQLAKYLREFLPNLNIIFVSAYDQYGMEAYKIHASGYLLKPVVLDSLREELQHLRYPIEDEKTLYFRCFGNFEVLLDGAPLIFKLDKTKEMLAYLFDHRESMCGNNEIMCALWEDDNHVSYLKQLRKDLTDTFEEVGMGSMLVKKYGKIGLFTNGKQSDIQEWLKGDRSVLP
ncbi:MAG: response regulator, partial [Lachnospiraceae bacterium]|nr:response regulator [Lachnospiraceae bacterium]